MSTTEMPILMQKLISFANGLEKLTRSMATDINIFRLIDMFPHTDTGGYVPCEQINRGYVPGAKSANRQNCGYVPDRIIANRRGYE